VLLLGDGRILVQIGDMGIGIIDGDQLHHLSGIDFVGRSPGGRYIAVARGDGIEIRDGWEGPTVSKLSWPTGLEGVPREFHVPMKKGVPFPKALFPFPQGDRVLLVSSEGIFVVGRHTCRRLLKTTAEIREYLASVDQSELAEGRPYDCFDLHMAHAAISPDGRWIACGHQGSNHLLFDANTCELVGTVLPQSSYPDFAAFSRDGSMVALNACHWHHGSTLGVSIAAFSGGRSELSTDDPEVVRLDREARVCASSSRHDEFIFGDAYGMLRAIDLKGRFRWQHFIGSTINAIDVSPDGKRLVVTSCAGFLCILDLDSGTRDPHTIGTATHREVRRWLFWKKEPRPLIW
jgi:hypothetical protein